MTTQAQSMIAALDPARTARHVYAGYRPALAGICPGQWVTWKLGDSRPAGTVFRVATERLCDFAELASGERVLNVTADHRYEPLARSEKLPFRTNAFDVVLSGFGSLFAHDHFAIAGELLRVCRPGGRIGLAAWTPDGFGGQLTSLVEKYSAVPAVESPIQWGSKEYLNNLFGHSADALGAAVRHHAWRYDSVADWLEAWQSPGGPLQHATQRIDPDWRHQFDTELLALAERFNEASDGSLVIESEYLEFLVHKTDRQL